MENLIDSHEKSESRIDLAWQNDHFNALQLIRMIDLRYKKNLFRIG